MTLSENDIRGHFAAESAMSEELDELQDYIDYPPANEDMVAMQRAKSKHKKLTLELASLREYIKNNI